MMPEIPGIKTEPLKVNMLLEIIRIPEGAAR
jgi:hypothetical protein